MLDLWSSSLSTQIRWAKLTNCGTQHCSKRFTLFSRLNFHCEISQIYVLTSQNLWVRYLGCGDEQITENTESIGSHVFFPLFCLFLFLLLVTTGGAFEEDMLLMSSIKFLVTARGDYFTRKILPSIRLDLMVGNTGGSSRWDAKPATMKEGMTMKTVITNIYNNPVPANVLSHGMDF